MLNFYKVFLIGFFLYLFFYAGNVFAACAANQCEWGDGVYFTKQCVSNGSIMANVWARMVCRSGTWRVADKGWGCDDIAFGGCDTGSSEVMIGDECYCRSNSIQAGSVRQCSAGCGADKVCTNGFCCDSGQCGWGEAGNFTQQCVNNGELRVNSWAKMICQNGTWAIPFGGWGCDVFGNCVSGSCNQIGDKYFCTNGVPLSASYFTSLDATMGTVYSGTCVDACAWGNRQCSGTQYQICGDNNGDGCLEWSSGLSCPAGQSCNNGQCVASCTSNCAGKVCGADGCGGSCGSCSGSLTCNSSGQCVASCTSNCAGKVCGADGCGGSCGSCSGSLTCNSSGQCVASCTPATCYSLGRECNTWSDGCGGILNCGSCASGKACSSGICMENCISHSSKKCDGAGLYWFNSCGEREDLYQSCGTNSLTTNYRCSGVWLQQGVIARDCVNGVCTETPSWNNVQNCSLTSQVCKDQVGCSTNDVMPPVLSKLGPSGKIYSANAVLTVTTSEDADCRYDTSDIGYDLMQSSLNSPNKKYHSAALVLSGYGNYTYYVRCSDGLGNKNLVSGKISFKYEAAVTIPNTTAPTAPTEPVVAKDATPPAISSILPQGNVDNAAVVLLVATDEKATCKYDTEDKKYSLMKETMESDVAGVSHSKSITLDNYGNYNYYVRCLDKSGNANSESSVVSFGYNDPNTGGPEIFNLQPSDAVYQPSLLMTLETDKEADCRYSMEDVEYDMMQGVIATEDGKSHQSMITLNDYGLYLYYIRCADKNGNKNKTSTLLSFEYKKNEEVPATDDQNSSNPEDNPSSNSGDANPEAVDNEPKIFGIGVKEAAIGGICLAIVVVIILIIAAKRRGNGGGDLDEGGI